MTNPSDSSTRDSNPDLITGEPGSHPVGVGVGSAGAAATGAAIGTAVGGPVGALVGGVIGAVAGGYGGKAVGEMIDPTGEDNHWREAHSSQPYAESGTTYEDYEPGYRSGYEGYGAHATSGGGAAPTFEEAEPKVRQSYESNSPKIPWEKARDASRAAWERVSGKVSDAAYSAKHS